MNYRTPALLAITLLSVTALEAGPPTFDVASVKISKAEDSAILMGNGMIDAASGRIRVPSVGGTVNMTNWSLSMCVWAAWDLSPE